jgi:hypothetical protein
MLLPCESRRPPRRSAFPRFLSHLRRHYAILSRHASRRFPPPWAAEETDACFIAPDTNGQEPGQRGAAKLLTRDEAWRIAANVARLPSQLLRKP